MIKWREQKRIRTATINWLIEIILLAMITKSLTNQRPGINEIKNSLIQISSIISLISLLLSTIIYLGKIFFIKKFKHIEEEEFFLNNKFICYIHLLLNIMGYCLLTISFIDVSSLILTTSLITINTHLKKEEKSVLFLSWEDKHLWKTFLFSLSVIAFVKMRAKISEEKNNEKESFLVKVIKKISGSIAEKINNLMTNGREALENLQNEFEKSNAKATSKDLGESYEPKKIMTLVMPFLIFFKIAKIIIKSNVEIATNLILSLILLNSINNSINERNNNVDSFWNNVNSIKKRKDGFKFFFNKFKNNKPIKIENLTNKCYRGIEMIWTCYENFELNPNFLKDQCISKEKFFNRKFIKSLSKIEEFIEIVEGNIQDSQELNFLIYWLFNKCSSFEELDNRIRKIKEAVQQ